MVTIPKICKIKNCTYNTPRLKRGLCERHYNSFRKYGDPLYIEKIKSQRHTRCTINGCSSPGLKSKKSDTVTFPKGYCGKHYRRKYIGNDPLTPTIHDRRKAIDCGDHYKIPLGRNAKHGYALISKEDAWIDKYNWTISITGGGYAVSRINGTQTLMHRLIMKNPKGLEIDHKNRVRLDNRRSNLRTATRSQNAANSVKRVGASMLKGIWFDKKSSKWVAKASKDKKQIYFGYFDNKEQAYQAYLKGARKLHGEFFTPDTHP